MLDELRKKPSYVRESYAFWGALAVTALVAVVWAFSLPIRFSEVDVYVESQNSMETSGAFSQFWNDIKSNASAVWDMEENDVETSSSSASEEPSDFSPEEETASVTGGPTSSPPVIQIATSSSSNR